MTFKIEYTAIGMYTSKAYVSWLLEGRTARGVHKHTGDPVYVRWHADRQRWVEDDPAHIIAECVLSGMGHCDDCALLLDSDKPPRCDCARAWVVDRFAEIIDEKEG